MLSSPRRRCCDIAVNSDRAQIQCAGRFCGVSATGYLRLRADIHAVLTATAISRHNSRLRPSIDSTHTVFTERPHLYEYTHMRRIYTRISGCIFIRIYSIFSRIHRPTADISQGKVAITALPSLLYLQLYKSHGYSLYVKSADTAYIIPLYIRVSPAHDHVRSFAHSLFLSLIHI